MTKISVAGLRPCPRASILSIDPYVPGKSGAPGPAKVFKLSANETPLGASPLAKRALRDFAGRLHDYPDGQARALREAIGAYHGLDPQKIVCGNGSDEILHLLASAYIGPGDEGIFTEHGFLVYKIAILAAGGTPVVAGETGLKADPGKIFAKVGRHTKIIFLANPNNPTGTYLTGAETKRLAQGLPGHILLVIDAAYAEYANRADYSPGHELVEASENVVVTRTFSKIYGLASLRLGWCHAPPDVCDVLNRIRAPFNTSGAARAAGIAALQDTAHLARAVAHNETWLPWLEKEILELGINVTPSAGNFLLLRFSSAAEAMAADRFLTQRGLILRAVSAYGLPHCLRLTVGPEEANRLVVASLKDLFLPKVLRVPDGLGARLNEPLVNRLALIGMGLIGSSLARVCRRKGLARDIIAADLSPEVRAQVAELALADRVAETPAAAVEWADLVIFCVPVGAMGAVAQEIAPYLMPGATVSDTGSVKTAIIKAVAPHVPATADFVPAHPVAGTEQSGPSAGFATLFLNRWCILTPLERTSPKAVARLTSFWTGAGANVEVMDAPHHDLVLAITSHVPHLIAYNIVGTAADLEQVTESEVIKFSAGGFRDFTRIAASDPTMWRDIFLNNKEAVLETLGRFNEDLSALQRMIRNGDGKSLFDLFTRTRAIRRGIIEQGQETAAPDFGRRAGET